MKIVSFINTWQRDVIDKILTHCGLLSRAPPAESQATPAAPLIRELTYVSDIELVQDPGPVLFYYIESTNRVHCAWAPRPSPPPAVVLLRDESPVPAEDCLWRDDRAQFATASCCSLTQPASTTSVICRGVFSIPALYGARSTALG